MRSLTATLSVTCAAVTAAALFAVGTEAPAQAGPPRKAPKSEIVELGRRLFMDPTVSRLGKHSCASCHDPERAFGDTRTSSPDDTGPTKRHSQTLVDLSGDGFHWDGEFKSVRQLLVARVAPAEMANEQAQSLVEERFASARRAGERPTAAAGPAPVPGTPQSPPAPSGYGVVPPSEVPVTPVAERLAEDGRYAESFRAAFGTPTPTTERILDAMDAYCATIRSTTNAFDRFLAGDDAALSPAAMRGLALFEGKAACSKCHVTRTAGGRAPFTDGKFHDTGVAYHTDPNWQQGLVGEPAKDLGRGGITLLDAEHAKFKTPTLRDVAARAPYMHDGSFPNLESVVRYYARGGTKNPNLDTAIRPLDLSDAEIEDLVLFLESLTGSERAGLGFPLRHAAPLALRVEDLSGAPIPSLTISVSPAGDRLLGASTVEAPGSVVTDEKGTARIVRPLWTHVSLSSPGFDIGLGRPIPDTSESQTLIATPRDTVSLRIGRTPDGPSLPSKIEVLQGVRGRSMGSCGPPTVTTLTRIRTLSSGEALYAGKAPAAGSNEAPQRCTLLFDSGGTAVVAEIRLSGGASESIRLDRPHRSASAKAPDPPPLPGGEPAGDPGEGADHGDEKDRGGRDTGDRR